MNLNIDREYKGDNECKHREYRGDNECKHR